MPALKRLSRILFLSCVLALMLLALATALQQAIAGQTQSNNGAPLPGGVLEFLGEWGMRGQGPGQLSEPVAMAADVNERIYIADKGSQLLQKFDAAGFPLFSYQDASMRTATALAIDSGGGIYVADATTGRVWIHWPEGELLRNFRITPQRAANGVFGFCVTADGTIVVPDAAGARVQAFSPGGQLKISWKIPPSTNNQAAPIAVSSSGFDDFVYVADATSGRIYKFTNHGQQEAVWEPPADSTGALRAIAVSRNHVFVLRGTKPQMEIWDVDGKRMGVDTLGGLLDASSKNLPLAATPDEQVFVLDTAKSRVLRFQLRP
jgi:hypothetical protein